MPLNWDIGKNADDVPRLIASGQYELALELLQRQLQQDPTSVHLRQSVADVMLMTGKKAEAMDILLRLSDDLMRDGFPAKAVAILKKIERFAAERTDDYRKLASELPRSEEPGDVTPRGPVTGSRFDEAAHDAAAGQVLEARAAFEDFINRQVHWLMEQTFVDADGVPGAPKTLTTPLFESFTPEELFPLLRGLRLVTYEPGDIIVAEGGPDEALYIVTSGRVKAFVRNAVGHFGKVRELTDGDFFGEIAFLRSRPRTATVTAAARCEILILDNARLEEICELYPHARVVLERFSAERENSPIEVSVRKSSSIRQAPDEAGS
jgi:Cyclic nucleotide-binding domain/Tetratricopeptide repeat